jgi:hypothetical protein
MLNCWCIFLRIAADGYALRGSLPVEIGFLTNLVYLRFLVGEELQGQIPDLSRLTKLDTLQLLSNGLTGTIPTTLGLLTSLTHFDLSENLLVGPIPTELAALWRLEELYLEHNYLEGRLPSELGNIQRLRKNYCAFYCCLQWRTLLSSLTSRSSISLQESFNGQNT